MTHTRRFLDPPRWRGLLLLVALIEVGPQPALSPAYGATAADPASASSPGERSGQPVARMPPGGGEVGRWGMAQERPRVERLVFEGAEAVAEGVLRASIVTDETRCLGGFLLRPLCWVTDWALIHDRYFLDATELPRDELRLRTAYARRGYREAEVASTVRPRGGGVEVVFHIREGEPTLIESVRVRQSEEVLSEGPIRRAGLPEEGEPLNLIALDTAVANLAAALGERGYLDAVVTDTVEVIREARRARLEVLIEPGPRSTVATIEVRGNEEVSDRTVTRALRLREGRVLRTRDMIASQRSLYESNLFHEAQVTVPPQPDSAKRVLVEVREASPRAARVGGGFNTVDFGQVEGRVTHYNWLGGGRRLDVRGTVGNLLAEQLSGRGLFQDVLPATPGPADDDAFLRPTWIASTELRQPAFRTASTIVGLGAFTHRRIVPGIVVETGFGGDVSLTRQLDFQTPLSVEYRYERTAVEAGELYFCVNYGICDPPTILGVQGRHSLSPVQMSFVANRSDDPLSPTTGYRTRVDVEHSSSFTLADFRYNRVSGAAAYYHPLGLLRRSVLAFRGRAGWIRPLDSTGAAVGTEMEEALIHPRKRFYSGGARSVRGYRENQLGPRILTIDPSILTGEEGGCTTAEVAAGTCDPGVAPAEAFIPRPLGGTSVIEGNVEYRFPLGGGFIGAVFVDGAVVGDGFAGLFAESVAALTPGVGARLDTPFGPIRVDLGIRPGVIEHLQVMTETVDEAGQRQLVRLEQVRRFDPIEARGDGFLNQVLGRLTLHLSIGEAF